MKAGHKFLVGALVIVAAVTYLIYEGVKQTGTYFFTPTELAARTAADPTFHNVGVKMGAKVVPGTIRRDAATQTIDFQVTDGVKSYPVTYRGVAPDTFTDGVDVVVEGRMGQDGTFHATTLLAKCGSRYEAQYEGQKEA
jgi:cytochrome c-type biogenesis protein CcmE